MRAAIVAILVAVVGLATFHYFAPLQPASVAVWAGVVAGFSGLVFLVKPLGVLGVANRRVAGLILAAGFLLFSAGLLWPATTTRATQRESYLDEVMPAYDFYERHVERVHASPDRVVAAWQKVSFNDIKTAVTLMDIRALAGGHIPQHGPGMGLPILKVLSASGFTPVHEDPREVVFVLAGRPWSGGRSRLRSAEDFAVYHEPNAVRMATNLRVVDEGSGWSTVITETRIQATDNSGRRTMARYWRVIYPGSGMIRRMWLKAIRTRAENSQQQDAGTV